MLSYPMFQIPLGLTNIPSITAQTSKFINDIGYEVLRKTILEFKELTNCERVSEYKVEFNVRKIVLQNIVESLT